MAVKKRDLGAVFDGIARYDKNRSIEMRKELLNMDEEEIWVYINGDE